MDIKKQSLDLLRVITDPIAGAIMSLYSGPYPIDVRSYLDSRDSDGEASDHLVEYFENGIEQFKKQFAIRMVQYCLLVVGVLGLICIIDQQDIVEIPLQVVGVSIDILGAAILARGLLSGPISLGHQSISGYGGYNTLFLESLIRDAVDGTWGVFLLFIGFAIQAYAVF